MRQQIVILMLAVLFTTACAKQKKESEAEVNAINSSAEGGITTINALIDDQAGSTFVASVEPSPAEKLFDQILPKAYAASCLRAFDQSCNAGSKVFSTASCDLPRGFKFSGRVQMAYNNVSCSMSSTGDQVTRTYDYDISGPYGGAVLAVTSDGGGGRLTKTAGGWTAEVLGQHKVLTWRGQQILNLNISTPQPLEITGSLNRSARVVNSGSFQVVHNLAGFTALYEPHNLAYTNACCHPVSGSLDVSYSGSITGGGTITFNSCGSATLVRDNGAEQEIALNYCE
jgi:hypothetical protein